MLRWLFAIVVLLLIGLGYGLVTGEGRQQDMVSNVMADLTAQGYDWAYVSIDGNLVTLTGTAPSLAAQQKAVKIAEDAYCSECKNKPLFGDDHRWHEVEDATDLIEIAALPVQSPYTFSARKSEDGSVTLNGFVPSEAARGEVLRQAVQTFGNDNVTDDRLQIADGAPDDNWADVIKLYFGKLARLDTGRMQLEDFEGSLQGETTDQSMQDGLYDEMERLTPDGYNFVGNVSVLGGASRTIGQSNSQAICQSLLDDLRRGKKILFDQGEAQIRGDDNLNLLGRISSAMNQCPTFRIAINGYTSSEGPDDLNQRLSERRANAVLSSLNDPGSIDLSRMSATGFGESNPVASNDTIDGREANRRIEFILSRAE